MNKTEQFGNHPLILLVSGILVYKGLGLLEALLSRLFFLTLPFEVPTLLRITLYTSYTIHAIIVLGLLRLMYLVIKKKSIPIFNNRRFFRILGISFLIVFTGEMLLRILSDDTYKSILEEYAENGHSSIGRILIKSQLSSVIIAMIRGVLILILFFVSLGKSEKLAYEWPISSKNEYLVPTSIEYQPDDSFAEQPIKAEKAGSDYEDAIYFNDDTCALIWGDAKEGYNVTEIMETSELTQKEACGWTHLSPTLMEVNGDFIALAGEISHSGAGFIGLKKPESESFLWLIHLSTMNNPVKLSFENGIIQVKTDLNFPYGVLYTVPVHAPENFSAKILTNEDSSA